MESEKKGNINCLFSVPVEVGTGDYEFSKMDCSYDYPKVKPTGEFDLVMATFLFLILITLIMGYFVFRVLGIRIKKTMI